MSDLHPARQAREVPGNAVHLPVNLKRKRVKPEALLKRVRLWVGICTLDVVDLNDILKLNFSQLSKLPVPMKCLLCASRCIKSLDLDLL